MSKIGKQPVKIPESVTVKSENNTLLFKGPKGEAGVEVLPGVSAKIENGEITFKAGNETKQTLSNWGTTRSLAEGAVIGVVSGFEKVLEIEGVGFRAALEGKNLVLNIGYSHPVKVEAPEGIVFSVDKNTMKVSGISKYLVGQTAAYIRSLKKPEPYKGKGIHYRGEVIRRKAGKKVAGTA